MKLLSTNTGTLLSYRSLDICLARGIRPEGNDVIAKTYTTCTVRLEAHSSDLSYVIKFI